MTSGHHSFGSNGGRALLEIVFENSFSSLSKNSHQTARSSFNEELAQHVNLQIQHTSSTTSTTATTPLAANFTSSSGIIPEDVPFIERITNISVIVPILLFGVVGNFIVAWVIITGKNSNQRTKSNAYVLSLAIADMVFLFSGPGMNLMRYVFGTKMWLLPNCLCPVAVFLSFASANSGAVIIACFSVERFLAVHYPLRLLGRITLAKQLVVVVIAVIISGGYSIVWLIEIAVSSKTGECTFMKSRKEYLVFFLTDFSAFFVLPVFVMIFANGFIVYRIVRVGFDEDHFSAGASLNGGSSTVSLRLSRESRKSFSQPAGLAQLQSTPSQANMAPLMQRHVVSRTGSTMASRPSLIAGSSSDSKLATKMLVAVSLVFIACCAPYRLFVIGNSFFGHLVDTNTRIWMAHCSRWLWYFNSAVNPIIYNILSSRFRRAILHLCVASGKLIPNGFKQASSRFHHADSSVVLNNSRMYSQVSTDDLSVPTAQIGLLYSKSAANTPKTTTPSPAGMMPMVPLHGQSHSFIRQNLAMAPTSPTRKVVEDGAKMAPTDEDSGCYDRVDLDKVTTPVKAANTTVFFTAGWN